MNTDDFLPLEVEYFENSPVLSSLRIEAIEQLRKDASRSDIRDDYAEMNDICLKLLGVETNKKIRVLGALSKLKLIMRFSYLLHQTIQQQF